MFCRPLSFSDTAAYSVLTVSVNQLKKKREKNPTKTNPPPFLKRDDFYPDYATEKIHHVAHHHLHWKQRWCEELQCRDRIFFMLASLTKKMYHVTLNLKVVFLIITACQIED